MRTLIYLSAILGFTSMAYGQQLVVGIETAGVDVQSSDLTGFPDVAWSPLWNMEVSGAAASPDGALYLCNGSFTTHLYKSTNLGTPVQIATLSEDIHALAYGNGKLYGYSNFADTKGIYEINTSTGECTLVLDVYTDYGFRFFALGYNPVDGLLYGYTEYGDSGLYSININSGEMIKIVGTIPASNGQGRGLAVGNNTIYLTATRGDDGIPYFAYDLAQGVGGEWVPFNNPYTDYHSTGAAAWIPAPCTGDLDGDGDTDQSDLGILLASYENGNGGDLDGDGDTDQSDLGILLANYNCNN